MSLHIIATGGTFEKHYDEISGQLVFGDSHVPQLLKRARVSVPCTFETVCMLDSLDMQHSDRLKVLRPVQIAHRKKSLLFMEQIRCPETAKVLGHAALGENNCSDRGDDTL